MGANIRELKKKRDGFVANTFTLMSGSVIAEVITVTLMPIITRLYPPQTFGLFSILVSIVSIIMPLSHLRYHVAIQLPLDEDDADALALLCMILVSVVSLLLLGITLVWGDRISILLKFEGSSSLLYYIPVAVFLGGTTVVLNSWYLRAKEFKRLALSKIAGAVGDRTVTLAMGIGGLIGPGGLVAGRLTGYLFNNLVMTFRQRTLQVFSLFLLSRFKRLRKVAIQYKEFPKYAWSGLFQQLSMQMPVILLGFFFTPAIVGFFALSRRALMEPMALIGEAFSRSVYQKLSETHRAGKNLTELTERLFHYLMVFVIFPMMLLGMNAVEVFSLVFGEKWQQAGFYAGLLVPTFITIFVFRPIGIIFDLLEKQKEAFVFNVLFFMVNVVSIAAGGMLGRPLLTVGLFSLSTSMFVASRIVWLMAQIGVSPRSCARITGSAIARSLVFAIPLILLKYLWDPAAWIIISVAVLLLTLYFIYLLWEDTYLKNEFCLFVKHYF